MTVAHKTLIVTDEIDYFAASAPSSMVNGTAAFGIALLAIQIFSEPFFSTPCSFHSVRPPPRP